jgi:F-type H+-transporting ATPase subunit alpha
MTKQVAGKMKGELAQFRELAAFAQFGSDLDAATKAQLDRGSRIVELFKQPALNPIAIEVQAGVLFGMQNKYFDDVAGEKIVDAAESMREFLLSRKKALLEKLLEKGSFDDAISAEMKAALNEWKTTFVA